MWTWFESLIFLVVVVLFICWLLVKGLPWLASRYASYRLKAKVSLKSMHFFRWLEFRQLSIQLKNNYYLYINKVQIKTNLFTDVYSSLLIVTLTGIHLKLPAKSKSSSPESNSKSIQKLVNVISYLKFLVTIVVEDVKVSLNAGFEAELSAQAVKIHPESMRNGLANLNVEIHGAEARELEQNVSVKVDKVVTNAIIHVMPAELDTFEFIVGDVTANVPSGFIAKTLDVAKVKRSNQKGSVSGLQKLLHVMPNLEIQMRKLQVSIADEKHSVSSTLCTLNMTFQTPDNLLAVDIESYTLDFRDSSRYPDKVVDVRTIKARWSPSIISAIFSHLNLKLNINHAQSALNMVGHGHNTPKKSTNCTLQLAVVQGTFDQPSSEMTVIQMQSLVSSLGDELAEDITSFDVQDLHCSLDSDKREIYVTSSQISSYLAEKPLKVAFAWQSFVSESRKKLSFSEQKTQRTKWNKASFRTANSSMTFVLPNGIEMKCGTGPLKVKQRSSWLKSCDVKDQSMSVKDIRVSVFCMSDSSPVLKTVLQVPSISYHKKHGQITVKFSEAIDMYWSTLIHRIFYDLNELIQRHRTEESPANGGEETKVCLTLEKGANVTAKLQTSTVQLALNQFDFNKYQAGYWKVDLPNFEVRMLHADATSDLLLSVHEILVIKTLNSHSLVKKFRQEVEGLEMSDNKTVLISMKSCELSYPPELNVHSLFSGEFLGVFKWLKVLHNRSGTEWDKIHPDVWVSVKQLSVEFQDDPFEVCLRDNFELLEDEFYESMKRFKCLQNRIEELKKNLLFQPSKIEELYTNLSKRNADIYVQRAKSLKENVSKRTRLLSFTLTSLECMMFSDASMTGKPNIIRFMQQVDAETPWPDDIQFTSAYFKWLRFQCKSASVMLRDFPQSLADAKNITCWGKCVFAEQRPMDRAVREQAIDQGRPYYDDHVLKRSLLTYKMYHDLAIDMDCAYFSHGPCWEPTLSQFSIALSYVTGKSGDKDPSPALAWWDKLRYLMHGRLLFSLNKLKFLLHTSPDPYNTTEEVELTLSDANFDWSNSGVLKCGAHLNLYVRTASKYDDCQLLHVPNLSLTIQLDWICLGNPRDHHAVMLCAKEKVPEHSLKGEHDSWRAFRSQNVNVHINFETKWAKSHPEMRPRLEMFSSTVRWMESLKWLFSGASRPIRRGRVFKNVQPLKQSFFRHFSKIRFSISLHQLQFDYWTSASMTKGVLINIAQGISLSSEYSLKLVKINDGLIHRPRSEWTAEFMNCVVGTSDIWFQSSVVKDGSRQIEKSFFISVEDVQYNRDVAPNARLNAFKMSPSHILTVNGAKGAWTESNRDMAFALYDSWRRAHILRNQVSSEGFLKQVTIHVNPDAEDDEPVQTVTPAATSSPTSTSSSSNPKESLGELSLSSFAGWTVSTPMEKMVEVAGEGSGGGCVPIVYSEDQVRYFVFFDCL